MVTVSQTVTILTGLESHTEYFVFARQAENRNRRVGAPSVGLAVRTSEFGEVTPDPMPDLKLGDGDLMTGTENVPELDKNLLSIGEVAGASVFA